jgi:U3 small nucleolar RNA-associated protein 22
VGSYASHAVARPETTVDIAVQLPLDLLAPKAHLNYRYHVARAVYLVAVARHLRDVSYSLFGEQRLQAFHGDPTRPALLLLPPKAEGYSLRLLPSIAPTVFALPRLAPDRNGVRSHCKATPAAAVTAAAAGGEEGSAEQKQLLPTPHYNAGILEDMLLPVHAARLKVGEG